MEITYNFADRAAGPHCGLLDDYRTDGAAPTPLAEEP
jgi:hypothetical protein